MCLKSYTIIVMINAFLHQYVGTNATEFRWSGFLFCFLKSLLDSGQIKLIIVLVF